MYFLYCWVVPSLLQTVNPVIIKNTKKYKKNTTPNYKKIQHWAGQNYQQKENTTYIDGFAVLFFDGMSKERKKYKRTKCNLWRTGKIQKKYKNTNCIFGRNGKIQKKYRNTKCIVFVFYLYVFVFLPKKIRKKYKKNTNAIAQKYKIQKNILVQKWAREPTPCSFWKARTKLQNKCKANLLYFLNPANQILYFELYFFVFFSYF